MADTKIRWNICVGAVFESVKTVDMDYALELGGERIRKLHFLVIDWHELDVLARRGA